MRQEQTRENDGIVEKFCPRCDSWKDRATEFSPKRGGTKRVHSWCKKCCVDDVSSWRKSNRKKKGIRHGSVLTERLQRILANMIRQGTHLRSSFLREQYERQQGKCYYTGVEMKLMTDKKSDPMIMSCDRIDSSKGYEEGNVVLCCLGINHLKGRHSAEYMYECLQAFAEGAKMRQSNPRQPQ